MVCYILIMIFSEYLFLIATLLNESDLSDEDYEMLFLFLSHYLDEL